MLIQIILLFIFVMHQVNAEATQNDIKIPEEYMNGLSEGKLHLQKQGVNLHYVTNGLKESSELLVFYHGFPQFWYTWRHQLQYFKQKYTVYAFDLRGFGLSDRPNGVLNYTIDQQLEDMAETIQMLKAQPENADKRVTMVCHDIGTAVGAMMNYHYPDLVDRLVMINAPNPRTLDKMLKEGKLSIAKVLKTPYFYKVLTFQFPYVGENAVQGDNFAFFEDIWLTGDKPILNQGNNTFDRADLEVYKGVYSQTGAVTSALNFYRAPLRAGLVDIGKRILSPFMSNDSNNKQLPDKIKAKCLVLWGEHDAAFGVEFGQAAVDACEQGKLVPLNASHWVPEDVPDQVNSLIEQFVLNK